MIRVINARKLLETIRKLAGTRFTIQLQDDLIPENNGIWEVTDVSVEKSAASPDISMDIRTLGPLAAGGICLAEAEYREDVTIYRNRAMLDHVFTRKSAFVQDRF